MEKKQFIDVLRERVVAVERELRLLKEALAVYDATETNIKSSVVRFEPSDKAFTAVHDHNTMLVNRIKGVPENPGTEESDSDPANPNVKQR